MTANGSCAAAKRPNLSCTTYILPPSWLDPNRLPRISLLSVYIWPTLAAAEQKIIRSSGGGSSKHQSNMSMNEAENPMMQESMTAHLECAVIVDAGVLAGDTLIKLETWWLEWIV